MTLRRREAPLVRSLAMEAALRSSREALARIEGELGALLAALRDPEGRLDAEAADRIGGASRRAGAALATLGALAQRR
jgi:hypothetical protein